MKGIMQQIEEGEDITEFKNDLTLQDLENIVNTMNKYKSNLSGGIVHLCTVYVFKEFCRANGGYERLKHTDWQIHVNSEVQKFIERYERMFQ